jgi:hypothetical protein
MASTSRDCRFTFCTHAQRCCRMYRNRILHERGSDLEVPNSQHSADHDTKSLRKHVGCDPGVLVLHPLGSASGLRVEQAKSMRRTSHLECVVLLCGLTRYVAICKEAFVRVAVLACGVQSRLGNQAEDIPDPQVMASGQHHLVCCMQSVSQTCGTACHRTTWRVCFIMSEVDNDQMNPGVPAN